MFEADPQPAPPKEQSNADPEIAGWIPLVPLAALPILICVYLIYSEVLS
jgi:hypothetical protein